MPIRYCTAHSKRTHQLCRARAMRGMNVCYHHGGKSRRGIVHPNYKHGFYCKQGDLFLMVAFEQYRQRLREAQIKTVVSSLTADLPVDTSTYYKRLRAALHVRMQRIPRPKLTAKLAAELMGRK